jgi:hypothetical protein
VIARERTRLIVALHTAQLYWLAGAPRTRPWQPQRYRTRAAPPSLE